MIFAHFHLGPLDSQILPLPTLEPWPHYVAPAQIEPVLIPVFYLLSGQEDEMIWSYLYDEGFEVIL